MKRPQGAQLDGFITKKAKVDLNEVKELTQVLCLKFRFTNKIMYSFLWTYFSLVLDKSSATRILQAQEVRKALITDDAEQDNEDLDDFLPAADNDAEDFEDDADEGTCDSKDLLAFQSSPSTPSNRHSAPKPILKVRLSVCC